MDPRQHVAAALTRLLAQPEDLPPRDSPSFRNRLLDEAGGDYRPLVVFLLQLSEAGVPERMRSDAAAGLPWDVVRRRLVVEWTAEHFSQRDVTQWAIEAWGTALGLSPATEITAPVLPATAPARVRTQAPRRIPVRLASPTTPVVLASPAPLPRSPSTQFAVAVLGTSLLVAMFALWSMPNDGPANADVRFGRTAPLTSARDTLAHNPDAPTPRSTLAMVAADTLRLTTGDSLVGRAEWSNGRRLRFRDLASGVTFDEPLGDVALLALAGGPRLDSVALARYALSSVSPDSGSYVATLRERDDATIGRAPSSKARDAARAATALLAGNYRVSVRRAGAYGNAGCGALDSSMAWNQDFVEHISVAEDSARFRFASRPTIAGTVFEDGSFQSVPVQRDRPAARTVFLLTGRLTPEGFVATGDTRTQSTIRYRQTRSCRFVAQLVGTRIR